jgi:hypothetical protein
MMPVLFEYVGDRPVILKPASAIGGPLLVGILSVYVVLEDVVVGVRRSMLFE